MPQPFRLTFAAAAVAFAALACPLPAAGQPPRLPDGPNDAAIDEALFSGVPGKPGTGLRMRLLAELEPVRWAELRDLFRRGYLARREEDRAAISAEMVDFSASIRDSVTARLRSAPPASLDKMLHASLDLVKELAVRDLALCANLLWQKPSDILKIHQIASTAAINFDIESYRAALTARDQPTTYPPYDEAALDRLKGEFRTRGAPEKDIALIFSDEKPAGISDDVLCGLTLGYHSMLLEIPDDLRSTVAASSFSGDNGLGQ